MKVAITGATGFIGKYLLREVSGKFSTVVLGREKIDGLCEDFRFFDLAEADLSALNLSDIDVVVHCAGRAHIMQESADEPLALFREMNRNATIRLAQKSIDSGVKRFIFLSSIGVHGSSSCEPFTVKDVPSPSREYAVSKWEAEQSLQQLAQNSNMEIVIIRPPLVYGAGASGNFGRLINLIEKGLPLPFACISQNKRSFVSVTNLLNLIVKCIDHPKAAGETFLVSDDCDLSTSDFVRKIAQSLGRVSWQLPVPVFLYVVVGRLLGRQQMVQQLIGSCQIDISYTKETLGWVPPQSVEDALTETAKMFLAQKKEIL